MKQRVTSWFDILSSMMLSVLFVVCSLGCSGESDIDIVPGGIDFRPGDIVLRRGSGIASRVVMVADGSGAYSHIGIVAFSGGKAVVVHAVPGEPDYKGDEDRVKKETIGRFFSSINAEAGRVLRCRDSVVALHASQVALGKFKDHTLFDHDYDVNDTTRMYCSELVCYAYRKAGLELVEGGRHVVNLPGLKLDHVVFPSDFLRSRHLVTVAAFAKH